MTYLHRVILGTISLLALSACGGGSGGGGGAPTPVTAAIIDSNNVQAVASSSANAALQSGAFGGVLGSSGLTATNSRGLAKLYVGQHAKVLGPGVAISQVPIGPEVTPCNVDGSLTLSGEVANPLTISPDDFVQLVWAACDDGLGQIIDGLLRMTFTSFEGDPLTGAFLVGMTTTIDNFQVTEGSNVNSVDGDVSVSLDTRTPPIATATTSGNMLTVSVNGNTDTLSNFSSTVTEDMSMMPSLFTLDSMGTITSTRFDGSTNYETPVPFQSIGDAYPFTGELLVTGANNATLRLIALDDVNVRIEADYDGDGAVDETIDTTWDALINS